MRCMYCQGKMERGIVPFNIDRKGYHLTIDRISAWVCIQCGEVYFEQAEVEGIQQVLYSLDQQTERMAQSA